MRTEIVAKTPLLHKEKIPLCLQNEEYCADIVVMNFEQNVLEHSAKSSDTCKLLYDTGVVFAFIILSDVKFAKLSGKSSPITLWNANFKGIKDKIKILSVKNMTLNVELTFCVGKNCWFLKESDYVKAFAQQKRKKDCRMIIGAQLATYFWLCESKLSNSTKTFQYSFYYDRVITTRIFIWFDTQTLPILFTHQKECVLCVDSGSPITLIPVEDATLQKELDAELKGKAEIPRVVFNILNTQAVCYKLKRKIKIINVVTLENEMQMEGIFSIGFIHQKEFSKIFGSRDWRLLLGSVLIVNSHVQISPLILYQ
jgi:hypothetical protein